MEKQYLIGIDPGRTNTGIAVYDPKTKSFAHMGKYNLERAIKYLQTVATPEGCIAVIENPNLESNLYDGWAEMASIVRSYKRGNANINQVKKVYSVATKRAADVGKNRAAAQDIIAALKQSGVPTVQIRPSDRQRANRPGMKAKDVIYLNMPTKTNKQQFEQLTGHCGRSNEHSRDAATLVFGKTIKWAEMMAARQKHLQ